MPITASLSAVLRSKKRTKLLHISGTCPGDGSHLLLMYKIFYMRTFGLSHQIKGPTTVKLAKTGFNCKVVQFTITGPLF